MDPLFLAASNKPTATDDPASADGYVAQQMFTRVDGKPCHAAGTRLPGHLNVHHLGNLYQLFEPIATASDGRLDIRSMVKTKDLVIWFKVPATVAKEDFFALVEKFTAALKQCGIMNDPLRCELPDGLRVVS